MTKTEKLQEELNKMKAKNKLMKSELSSLKKSNEDKSNELNRVKTELAEIVSLRNFKINDLENKIESLN